MNGSIPTFAKYSVAAIALLAPTDGAALAQTLPNSPSNTGTAQEGPSTTWDQNTNYSNTGTLGIGGVRPSAIPRRARSTAASPSPTTAAAISARLGPPARARS